MTSSQGNNAIPKAFLKSRLALLIIGISVLGYNHEYLEFVCYYKYQCLSTAIDAGNGEKLGVCARHIFGTYGEAIVYDSSDQINIGQGLAARNPENRAHLTLNWRQAYKKLPLPDIDGDYGYTATPIFGDKHFYKIHWS